MHPRAWLSVLSFPLVAAFSLPILRPQAPAPKPQGGAAAQAQDPLAGLSDIQDVLSLVQQNYVDRPDMEKVIGGGIQAVLERAHPFNSLLSQEELRSPEPGPADAGLKVIKRGGQGLYAQVIAVIPGGPGAQAGIQVGDVIRKVDGDSVGGMSAFELERRLKGAEGSTLTLFRFAAATNEQNKVVVTRRRPAARALELKSDAQGLRVVVPDFNAGRAQELQKLLLAQDRQKPLALDFRECFEGSPEEAQQVAALFIPGSPFGLLQEAGKPEQVLKVAAGQPMGFAKVAVFQAPSTQGAAELLASALKKAGMAVVGERSLGLVVERARFPLRQGGAVELVHRRYVGAGGEKLDRQGVVPTSAVRGKDEVEHLNKLWEAALKPVVAPAPEAAKAA
ncbi:MAG TPA: PDZ domain-containing protein [Holophagaceae bacterium]|nr:PDZ domain-containing protein [Holophagaceae bacterium]